MTIRELQSKRLWFLAPILLLPGLILAPAVSGAQSDPPADARFVASPPKSGSNEFYVGNRDPLTANPLLALPIGSIEPHGWIRAQLRLMADGFVGNLTEVSDWCSINGNAWVSPVGRGEHGWEEVPYWLRGFTALGFIMNDQRIIDESRKWIEGVISSQGKDGFFGPRTNLEEAAVSHTTDNDLWPNMIMLYVLRTYYDATGDDRVLTLMRRYFKWQTTVPLDVFVQGTWQHWRAGDNLDSIYWLYNRTGEAWLLDLARINHEQTADWSADIPTWHGVNLAQGFREPAQYFQQSHDPRHLEATIRNYETFMGTYGQVPGGMFGADENARPGFTGPRQAAETCTMAEFMHSDEMLTRITGDPKWADRAEEIAFNSFPASMTPNLRGLHYLTAPNMVQLDRQSKSPLLENTGDTLSYNPWRYRCCQHNVAFGWPYFAESLWMATRGNGLAAVLYAPNSVSARVGDGTRVKIEESTDYPFRDRIEFRVSTEKPVSFPLYLRIPGWSDEVEIELNGRKLSPGNSRGPWLELNRSWQAGDVVRLRFPMKIRVKDWTRNKDSISVSRGPLTYSLRIEERWEKYGGTDQWPAYEVYPASAWNYGLIVDPDQPQTSFKIVEKDGPIADQPFELDAAPIELEARARRIPEWQLESNGLVGAIGQSPVRSEAPAEQVRLIPMGAARLRISAFPRIAGPGEEGKVWSVSTSPPVASFIWHEDQISAVNDGVVPTAGHQDAPKATFRSHPGTAEWIQYNFPEVRRLTSSEAFFVYDGEVELPQSWQILWSDGQSWRPVSASGDYPIEENRFSRVDFAPVQARAVRIVIQSRPEASSGVYEWRVGE